MAGPFDNPFGLSALSLPLREQRLKVLSSNLANADTPGYQRRSSTSSAPFRGQRTTSVASAPGRRAVRWASAAAWPRAWAWPMGRISDAT